MILQIHQIILGSPQKRLSTAKEKLPEPMTDNGTMRPNFIRLFCRIWLRKRCLNPSTNHYQRGYL